MKNTFLVLTSIIIVSFSFAQEEQSLGVFESDTTWLEEIIPFPISFAPEINYDGYEDLRFAKHWRDSSHVEFWTYTFAWHISSFEEPDEKIIETNIKYYYDGIMKAVNKKKGFEVPETTVLFIKANQEHESVDYIGKIYVYDSFNSEDMITLNVRVKVHHCHPKKSTTIVFQMSPQGFRHGIWNQFQEVKLKPDYCDF